MFGDEAQLRVGRANAERGREASAAPSVPDLCARVSKTPSEFTPVPPHKAAHDCPKPFLPKVSLSIPPTPSAGKHENSSPSSLPRVCQCFRGPWLQPLPTAPGWARTGSLSWRMPCWSLKRVFLRCSVEVRGPKGGGAATKKKNHKEDTSKDHEIRDIKFRPAQNMKSYNISAA